MIPETERMSAVDAAWLRMDRSTNLMMIVGVVVFDSRVDFRRFRRTIEERFLAFPRFRCRARPDAVTVDWEPDADFDLDRHVVRAKLPAPGGQAELEALVSDLASADLDRDRPIWQFHFVERFQGGSAVILRIHHCYADGMAMIRVFLTLTDSEANPAAGSTRASTAAAPSPRDKDETEAWLGRLAIPGAGLLRQAYAEGTAFLARAVDLTKNPEQAAELARHALGVAGELARVATLADDPPTRFKGPLGPRKIAAWTDPLPLTRSEVRRESARLHDQRPPDVDRGGRARRLPAPARRGYRRHFDPRRSAGQPARPRVCRVARKLFRSRFPRAADRDP